MSKIPYEIDVDRWICTELGDIRDMQKTHDYSRLLATVERIQYHAQCMEDALYTQRKQLDDVDILLKEENMSEEKLRKKINMYKFKDIKIWQWSMEFYYIPFCLLSKF